MTDTNHRSVRTRAFDSVVAQLLAANVDDREPVSQPEWVAALDVVRTDPTVVGQLTEPLDRIVGRVVADPTLPAFDDVMMMRRDVFDALLEGAGDNGFDAALRLGASAPLLRRHAFGDHRHSHAAALVNRYPAVALTSVLRVPPPDVDPVFLLLIAHELVMAGEPVPAECERLRDIVGAAHPMGLSALPLQLTRLEREAALVPAEQSPAMRTPLGEALRAELQSGMPISATRRDLIASLVSEDDDFVDWNGRYAVVVHDLSGIAKTGERSSALPAAEAGRWPPAPILTEGTGVRGLSPGAAVARLLRMADSPGAYSQTSDSKARLSVWRMLAGIVERPWPSPIEAIEEECARTEWFDVATTDPWFWSFPVWNCWVIARRQNQLIGLATTSVD